MAVPGNPVARVVGSIAQQAAQMAKADQGKGRKAKLKDLKTRQEALLDEVYAAVVG